MKLNRIGIVSTFPPTQCGIATYINDLLTHLHHLNPSLTFRQFELLDNSQNDSSRKIYPIRNSIPEDYLKASQFINSSDIDLLDIQHEFKIYGKPDGENIIILLDNVKKPIVTTLHTVNPELPNSRENIFKKVLQRSDLLFVFSKDAKQYLCDRYSIETEKILVIPHGTPSIAFRLPCEISTRHHGQNDLVFVSTGHMRESKGYEIAIQALNNIKMRLGCFHYYIVGANHPQNEVAERYRTSLTDLVHACGLEERITFINKYISQNELIELIQCADVCLLPYTRKEQSSSGVLALMIACGRPVVTTPFQFATSQITSNSGVVTKTFSSIDFSQGIESLIRRKKDWKNIMEYNLTLGQRWNWDNVAKQYYTGYEKAISNFTGQNVGLDSIE